MSSVLISALNITKSYSHRYSGSKKIVLSGCSLSIYPGETVGLTGPSGCGKSTFGRILAGLDKPDTGSIQYRDEDILTATWNCNHDNRRKIQVLFQDPGGSFNPVRTLKSSFEFLFRLPGVVVPEGEFLSILDDVGLHGEILSRFPNEISGGQAQRLALARILLVKPELIILDEPTSALDLSVQAQILHLLKTIKKARNISYLFISHDLEVLQFMCERITRIESGQIVPYNAI
nr:dipeptide/oligopeptide/nickel ABC transporter ATP-binding protein [uncultured Methanospirillum sp.]